MMNADGSIVTPKLQETKQPEEMSFEELRAQYDDAIASGNSLQAALVEKRGPYQEEIEAIEIRWAAENAELIKEHAAMGNKRTSAEAALRKAILEAYETDKTNKQIAPHLALSVQVRTEIVITDEEKLKEWLKKHKDFMIPAAPDLDAIKKAAKDGTLRAALKMNPFIELREKPVAVIGKREE